MVELLEFVVIAFGVSIFMFDILFGKVDLLDAEIRHKYMYCFEFLGEGTCVNKTSILCIIAGITNAMLPMAEINMYIFGEYTEKVDPTPFSVHDSKKGYFTDDYDLANPATRDTALNR